MDVVGGRRAGNHRQFDVLVVCTANLCRSPMIEGLLRARLAGDAARWSITSAGTHTDDGRPVHPLTAKALAEHDIALPDDWRSRQLLPEHVERADLVLTAARSHRSDVIRTDPRVAARTFTLRQFLRLLNTADAEALVPHREGHRGEELLDAALAARGLGPPVAPEADDIPDPVGRPYPVFRDLADEIADELRVLNGPVASIRPTAIPAPPTSPTTPARPNPWWALRSS